MKTSFFNEQIWYLIYTHLFTRCNALSCFPVCRKRMVGKFNDTEIDFEKWTNTPYNHAAVDRELQIQKKRNYPEDQRPPFPKPPIYRMPPKPFRRGVTFQSPVESEIPIMTMGPEVCSSAPPILQTA